jgi:hypothetical protein
MVVLVCDAVPLGLKDGRMYELVGAGLTGEALDGWPCTHSSRPMQTTQTPAMGRTQMRAGARLPGCSLATLSYLSSGW